MLQLVPNSRRGLSALGAPFFLGSCLQSQLQISLSRKKYQKLEFLSSIIIVCCAVPTLWSQIHPKCLDVAANIRSTRNRI